MAKPGRRIIRNARAQTRLRLANVFISGAAMALRSFGGTYHPVRGTRGNRSNEDRWTILRRELQHLRPESVLDIGCAEGWFVRAAAREFGCWGIGVDAKADRVLAGEIDRLRSGQERVAVMKAKVTPEAIRRLPLCDVTICLSVVYHVVDRDGIEGGIEFLRAIGEVTRKAMLFECGPPRLPGFRADGGTGEVLPADEQDPHIRAILQQAGFTSVEEVGRARAYGDQQRVIYRATSPRSSPN